MPEFRSRGAWATRVRRMLRSLVPPESQSCRELRGGNHTRVAFFQLLGRTQIQPAAVAFVRRARRNDESLKCPDRFKNCAILASFAE
jgi:hypothetical protein